MRDTRKVQTALPGRRVAALATRDHRLKAPACMPTRAHKMIFALGKLATKKHKTKTPIYLRAYAFASIVLLILSIGVATIQPFLDAKPYHLSKAARALLPKQSQKFADVLKFDAKQESFEYNAGYTGVTNPESTMSNTGNPRINASFAADPAKGMSVTDPLSQTEFTLKPKFRLLEGKQDKNQVLYRLAGQPGYLVYTAQAAGVKEDIVLDRYTKDTLEYEYELGLENGLEARLEKNGSIGVYGSELPINGQVATGSDADAELLEKVRGNAPKNKLLFSIPAPTVLEKDKTKSDVKVSYLLEGNKLLVKAEGLKQANYPLSIDPSIYVETAAEFMRGNNESNVDFDVSNELIQKGVLTGARLPSYTGTMSLPAARWNHGTVVAGGYVYVIGGNSGSTRVGNVYWAKLDTSNYTLVAPNPGAGACTNWCTNNAYDLPAGAVRDSMSVSTYNGYLYLMGGKDSGGTRSTTTYYAKIGANGEPLPWSTTTALSTERSFASAIPYNNKMYLLGGQTNGSTGGVATVEVANINPNGSLGTWVAAGITALTSGRWAHAALQYNGYLYVVGGVNGTTTQTTVQYIKVLPDGTLGSSWVTTTALPTARATFGGSMATISGGYMYINGGCSTVTATDCSSFYNTNTASQSTTTVTGSGTTWLSSGVTAGMSITFANGTTATITNVTNNTSLTVDVSQTVSSQGYSIDLNRLSVQMASINADGSVTDWTTYAVTGTRGRQFGQGFVAWRNTLYSIGGCIQPTASSNCSGTSGPQTANAYGVINGDGNLGPIENENAQPTMGNADGQVGRTGMGVVINNGYIYNIGGCSVNDCDTMSDNTGYAPINADGSIGTWLVDNSGLNGTTGVGGFGVAVYNNRVYVVGGSNGAAYVRTIFHAQFAADGSIGAWDATATNRLATAYGHSFVVTRADTATAGSIYSIGGCGGAAGIGCTAGSGYVTDVFKCPITNSTGAVGTCAETNQLQLGTAVGLMAGIYYANYIYLAGGGTSAGGQSSTVYFATINSSGNIVRADGAATAAWDTTTALSGRPRRRGVAVGVNGYIYVIGGHDGSGTPATLDDIQYAKIDQTTGDLGAWTTSTTAITPRWNEGAAAANGYVYVVGGCTNGAPPGSCSAQSGVNEKVQVYNNYSASPASYTSVGDGLFVTDRYAAASTIYNGYMYVAGGCTTATDCTTATNNVQVAPLNADGTVGTWANTTDDTLPLAKAHGQMEVVGGTLYFIGGQASGSTAGTVDIYYGTPDASGQVTAWNTVNTSNDLPAGRTMHSSTVWNNRIYVTGGNDGSSAASNVIYASPSLASGGDIGLPWTTTNMTVFTTVRSGHVAIAYGSFLYILGGFDGTNYLLDAQYAPINSSGEVGSWTQTEKLPQPVRQADGFASNGFLYLFGGRSAAAVCTNNTYVIPINANGSLGYWSQTNVRFNIVRYGASISYSGGRAYVLGGYNCAGAAFTTTDRVVHTTLQFQPQIANYSIAIDTDTDVFPTKFLANGLDNADGARWLLNYRSMNDTDGIATDCGSSDMTTWGQNTNFGAITLTSPGAYIPKDGSGTDTLCARYYFLNLTIDSQNAWGFPEDVSRGPTIEDLSLFFTSDPGKRLRHGKTFTDGLLQPLDTPF